MVQASVAKEVWHFVNSAPLQPDLNGQAPVEEDPAPSLVARICQMEVGGERQCKFTLLQTLFGSGVLTIPMVMKMTGLGLGMALIAFNTFVVFFGLDVLMRGAIRMQVKDTAALLAKSFGKWSGPLLDILLALYGNGQVITWFVRLGDFLPLVATQMIALGWIPAFEAPRGVSPRAISLLASLCVIMPMIFVPKLSGLRFLHPVALLSIIVTCVTVVLKCPANFEAHAPNGFSDISWMKVDWNLFEAYGILLLVSNCHLNAVPVVSEMKPVSHGRICRVSGAVAAVCTLSYGLLGAGGYLSFLAATDPILLGNYRMSNDILLCEIMLICCTWVGVPTMLNPTARSLRCFIRALRLQAKKASRRSFSEVWSPAHCRRMDSPLLTEALAQEGIAFTEEGIQAAEFREEPEDGSSHLRNEVVRIGLTFLCLVADVTIALNVTDLGMTMAIVGASAGTVLMILIPLAVLFQLGRKEFSRTYLLVATSALSVAGVLAITAIAVMPLQVMGFL